MYTSKHRNQIVENVIRYIDSPSNEHLAFRFDDRSIPFQNILEVMPDHIEGYVDVGYYDEVEKRNILLKVPEQCFEDFR